MPNPITLLGFGVPYAGCPVHVVNNHCEFCCEQLLFFYQNDLFTCSHLLPQLPFYSFQQSFVNGFCTLGRIHVYTL